MSTGRWVRFVTPPGRPLRWMLPVFVLAVFAVLQWQVPDWAERAEVWTVDARFSLRGAESPNAPIIIVALDEDSFQMLGELGGENIRNWPRARWAELIETIAAGEPRVIGLDVVLDTPGVDSGGDEALAQALSAAGNVILPSHLVDTERLGGRAVTLSTPVESLGEAAAGVGIANFVTDADGGVRRLGVLYPWGGQNHPYFSVIAAALFGGQLQVQESDLGTDGALPIHYRGPEGTFETVPLYRVLADDLVASGLIQPDEVVDPAMFKDAIVLVGYTTQLEQDQHVAPFGGSAGLPGVEIQANAIDTLLARDWLQRPADWLAILAVGVAGLLALIGLSLRWPLLGILLLLGGVIVYGVVAQVCFSAADLILPVVAPVASAVAVGGTALGERMVFAERDKRKLRRRFAGVMSPERLRVVLENWEALLESERPQKAAAVLFADVRGFTSTTEALMRQGRIPEMVRFLTAYLDAMTEAVFAEGGVVYDVVGDGLMILFGVPEPFADYGLRAVRAAARMALATEGLQPIWPLRDQRPMRMGIGVHCGLVVDAIVGRGRRVEYSVIGDPVNTSARIESHCKVAMEVPRPPGGELPETVTVLISEALYEQVAEHVLVDETVPPFEARGKSEPLKVVRLLGLRDPLP